MTQIRGRPDLLERYTEVTTAALGPARRAFGDYGDAMAAYLSAGPNDVGTGGVTDRSGGLDADVDSLADLDAQPAAFAWALRQVDRARLPYESGYRAYFATSQTELFDALVEARLDHPNASDEYVTDRAVTALAHEYADRLREIGLDDATSSQWSTEIAAEQDELADLFVDLAYLSRFDEDFAGVLVNDLGADGVHEVINRIRVQQTALLFDSSSYEEGHLDRVEHELLIPFSNVVARATQPGGASQSVLDDIAADAHPVNLGLLLANGDHDRRFLEPAFEYVWEHGELDFAHLDDLAMRVIDGDSRIGALQGLARDEELSWDLVTGDDDFRDDLLFDRFNDDSAAAGAVLVAGLHDHVVANSGDDALFAESQEAFADIVRVGHDDLEPGSRIALAQVSLLHLHDVALAAAGLGHEGPVQELDRDTLLEFYKEVMDEEAARDILADGLGVYGGLQFGLGAEAAAENGADIVRFNIYTKPVGELAALFGSAVEENVEDDADRAAFMVRAAQATASIIAGVGIAASPLSGGASIVAGGAMALAISEGARRVPLPSFDRGAARDDLELRFRATAVAALVRHDAIVERYGVTDGVPLDPDVRARLQDDDFIQSVIAGDAEALSEFNRMITENDGLGSAALEAYDEAWDPVLEYLGD